MEIWPKNVLICKTKKGANLIKNNEKEKVQNWRKKILTTTAVVSVEGRLPLATSLWPGGIQGLDFSVLILCLWGRGPPLGLHTKLWALSGWACTRTGSLVASHWSTLTIMISSHWLQGRRKPTWRWWRGSPTEMILLSRLRMPVWRGKTCLMATISMEEVRLSPSRHQTRPYWSKTSRPLSLGRDFAQKRCKFNKNQLKVQPINVKRCWFDKSY